MTINSSSTILFRNTTALVSGVLIQSNFATYIQPVLPPEIYDGPLYQGYGDQALYDVFSGKIDLRSVKMIVGNGPSKMKLPWGSHKLSQEDQDTLEYIMDNEMFAYALKNFVIPSTTWIEWQPPQ